MLQRNLNYRRLSRLLKSLARNFGQALCNCYGKKSDIAFKNEDHPASFSQWMNRNGGRFRGGFPNCWRVDPRLSLSSQHNCRNNTNSVSNKMNLDFSERRQNQEQDLSLQQKQVLLLQQSQKLERGQPQQSRGCPDLAESTCPTCSKLAVVIHIFYLELVREIVDRLQNIPVEFDVFITNATNKNISDDIFLVGKAQRAVVLEVDNCGRDIFPLIQLVNAGILDNYELILKVHTKKSAWRAEHAQLSGNGDEWRKHFLDSLLGSSPNLDSQNHGSQYSQYSFQDSQNYESRSSQNYIAQTSQNRVNQILGFFAENPQVGIVTASGNVLGADFWGGNKYLTTELAKRLELEIDYDLLQFPAGSMYWIRGFILQGLRALCLTETDFDEEDGQIDATTAHAIERLIGVCTAEAGLSQNTIDQVRVDRTQSYEYFSASAKRRPVARFIPFYLPQFHPNEQNDCWWGTGFTEWTNVTTAIPVFSGHNQPLLPADLGFYDLRLDEVRVAQAELAKWGGIQGFMYYYYWFSGQRLLDLPIKKLSARKEIDQPFCLMWANENWTRTWDGRTKDILIEQKYDTVPVTSFIDDIAKFLLDSRYLRVNGKAILAIYRPAQIPDLSNVIEVWRQRAQELEIGELMLLAVKVAVEFDGLGNKVRDYGLDGVLRFPPHGLPWKPVSTRKLHLNPKFSGNLFSYRELVDSALRYPGSIHEFAGVMANFDNTARRQWSSDIWWGANPYTFHRWIAQTVSEIKSLPYEERVVFINAWNEWAESAVLEPSMRWGKTYLQAVRNVAFS